VNRYHAFWTAWNAFFSGWFVILVTTDLFVMGTSWMTVWNALALVLAIYLTRYNFRKIEDY
jgi:hypothetical protein